MKLHEANFEGAIKKALMHVGTGAHPRKIFCFCARIQCMNNVELFEAFPTYLSQIYQWKSRI